MKKVTGILIAAVVAVVPMFASVQANAYDFDYNYDSPLILDENDIGDTWVTYGDIASGKVDSWVFEAPVTGDYVIESYESELDMKGYLYREKDERLLASDDDSGSGNNFKMTVHLKKDKDYRLVVKGYNSSAKGYFHLKIVIPEK